MNLCATVSDYLFGSSVPSKPLPIKPSYHLQKTLFPSKTLNELISSYDGKYVLRNDMHSTEEGANIGFSRVESTRLDAKRILEELGDRLINHPEALEIFAKEIKTETEKPNRWISLYSMCEPLMSLSVQKIISCYEQLSKHLEKSCPEIVTNIFKSLGFAAAYGNKDYFQSVVQRLTGDEFATEIKKYTSGSSSLEIDILKEDPVSWVRSVVIGHPAKSYVRKRLALDAVMRNNY